MMARFQTDATAIHVYYKLTKPNLGMPHMPATGVSGVACARRPGMVHTAILGRRLDVPVVNLGFSGNGKMDQAVGEYLDLVIAPNSSLAHLAGALGVSVWVRLSAYATDWRWLDGQTLSPWYPSLKLYRQQTPGDWDEALYIVSMLTWPIAFQAIDLQSNLSWIHFS